MNIKTRFTNWRRDYQKQHGVRFCIVAQSHLEDAFMAGRLIGREEKATEMYAEVQASLGEGE